MQKAEIFWHLVSGSEAKMDSRVAARSELDLNALQ